MLSSVCCQTEHIPGCVFVCVCGGDFISISSAAWWLVFCVERRPIKKEKKKERNPQEVYLMQNKPVVRAFIFFQIHCWFSQNHEPSRRLMLDVTFMFPCRCLLKNDTSVFFFLLPGGSRRGERGISSHRALRVDGSWKRGVKLGFNKLYFLAFFYTLGLV